MDYFFFYANFEEGVKLEEFDQVVTKCKIKQNLLKIVRKDYIFAINKISNFSLFESNENEDIFYIGRDFKNAKTNSGRFNLEEQDASFPYLRLKIDKKKKHCSVENDPLGLFTYFYSEDKKSLFVTNFLDTALKFASTNAAINIEEKSYYSLLCLGHTLPGTTLYKEIKASYPTHNISYSIKGLKRDPKHSIKQAQTAPSPKFFYETFASSVHTILKTSDIKWINLTGGMDTRLILSTLSEWERSQYEFVFDGVTSNPNHMPYDRAVVDLLKKEFNLNLRYTAPHTLVDSANDIITEYSFYNHLLTGMYGGESLGLGVLNCMPDRYQLDKPDESYLAFMSDYEAIESEMSHYIGSDHDSYFLLYNFLNASMSRIYNDDIWAYPTLLSQKKITPFINTPFLSALLSRSKEKTADYRLYYQMYEQCSPRMLEIPFYSTVTRFNFEKIKASEETKETHEIKHEKIPEVHEYTDIYNRDEIIKLNNNLASRFKAETDFFHKNFL